VRKRGGGGRGKEIYKTNREEIFVQKKKITQQTANYCLLITITKLFISNEANKNCFLLFINKTKQKILLFLFLPYLLHKIYLLL
jgi:hypothetical protein